MYFIIYIFTFTTGLHYFPTFLVMHYYYFNLKYHSGLYGIPSGIMSKTFVLTISEKKKKKFNLVLVPDFH